MKKITLIESEEKNPEMKIRLKSGMKVEMVEIAYPTEGSPKKGRAALCGWSDVCVALIEVGEEMNPELHPKV